MRWASRSPSCSGSSGAASSTGAEHYATVQPFLALFFVFYVAIAILYARRGPLAARDPVDGLLVFGVPLAGFASQAALVREFEYGAAWSALALAIVYALLFLALRRRREPGFPLLSRAFLVLAVIFATIAIPFALDNRWTAAFWAIEAAGVYWIGARQNAWLARAFALVVESGAGIVFVALRCRCSRRPVVRQCVFRRGVADCVVGARDSVDRRPRGQHVHSGRAQSRAAGVRVGRAVVARRRRLRARAAAAARRGGACRSRLGGRRRRARARPGAAAVLAAARGGRDRAAAGDGRRRAGRLRRRPDDAHDLRLDRLALRLVRALAGAARRARRCRRGRPRPTRRHSTPGRCCRRCTRCRRSHWSRRSHGKQANGPGATPRTTRRGLPARPRCPRSPTCGSSSGFATPRAGRCRSSNGPTPFWRGCRSRGCWPSGSSRSTCSRPATRPRSRTCRSSIRWTSRWGWRCGRWRPGRRGLPGLRNARCIAGSAPACSSR